MNTIVIGGTGAVGRKLIEFLCKDPNYSKIYIPCRRELDEWANYSEEYRNKMVIIKIDNLDFLGGTKEELEEKLGTEKFDSIFNCLGSRTHNGVEELTKVDKTYAINCAEICEKLDIPHYSLVSSRSADKDSCIIYLKIKGEAEEEVKTKNVSYLDIFEPGFLQNRDNDCRCGEWCMQYLCCCCSCCYPFIECSDVAKALWINDSKFQDKSVVFDRYKKTLTNDDIVKIVENYNKKHKIDDIEEVKNV
jgi:hypothetical protein